MTTIKIEKVTKAIDGTLSLFKGGHWARGKMHYGDRYCLIGGLRHECGYNPYDGPEDDPAYEATLRYVAHCAADMEPERFKPWGGPVPDDVHEFVEGLSLAALEDHLIGFNDSEKVTAAMGHHVIEVLACARERVEKAA